MEAQITFPVCQLPENCFSLYPPYKSHKSFSTLILRGIFSQAPFKFSLREFFSEKVWKSHFKLYNWLITSLLIRAYYHHFSSVIDNIENPSETLLYFYWGMRWSQFIPLINTNILKIVIRFHGSDLYEETNNNYIPYRRIQIELADKLVVISQQGMSYLSTKYPFAGHKAFISRLGTVDYGINSVKERRNQPKTIVSCSNLVPVKRVHLIIDILKHFPEPVNWIHFGDGIEKDRILDSCKTLPENVSWTLHGSTDHDELMRFFRSNPIDLFINVSSSEGIPVSVMEALSFGIPVVATDVGGTRELVDNSVGRLLPMSFNSQSVAKLILDLLNDPEIDTIRVQARVRWQERCQARNIYPSFTRILTRWP